MWVTIRETHRQKCSAPRCTVPGHPFAVSKTWQVRNPFESLVSRLERSLIQAILCTCARAPVNSTSAEFPTRPCKADKTVYFVAFRTAKMKGNPNFSRYVVLHSVKMVSSSSFRFCRPARDCSSWLSAVSSFIFPIFSQRSGWEQSSFIFRSWDDPSTTAFMAFANALTVAIADVSVLQRSWATQGECSYIPPRNTATSSFERDKSSLTVGLLIVMAKSKIAARITLIQDAL